MSYVSGSGMKRSVSSRQILKTASNREEISKVNFWISAPFFKDENDRRKYKWGKEEKFTFCTCYVRNMEPEKSVRR